MAPSKREGQGRGVVTFDFSSHQAKRKAELHAQQQRETAERDQRNATARSIVDGLNKHFEDTMLKGAKATVESNVVTVSKGADTFQITVGGPDKFSCEVPPTEGMRTGGFRISQVRQEMDLGNLNKEKMMDEVLDWLK